MRSVNCFLECNRTTNDTDSSLVPIAFFEFKNKVSFFLKKNAARRVFFSRGYRNFWDSLFFSLWGGDPGLGARVELKGRSAFKQRTFPSCGSIFTD